MKTGVMWLGIALFAVSLSPEPASAAKSVCVAPPDFVGCPSGEQGFNRPGTATAAGTVKYLNFGDELVFFGGEGGLAAVTIWGRNACGLWLQASSASGYFEHGPDAPLRRPKFQSVQPTSKDTFKVRALDVAFRLEQVAPGRFRVTLLEAIEAYEGE